MMTVHQVSELAGVSIRTLQYYDSIGLLPASGYTEAGYRLYDDSALERLQQIMLFRELEFPLHEIKEIMSRPGFDRAEALKQQITLLELKKEHIEGLIDLAERVCEQEEREVSFREFDKTKIEQYAAQAKEKWGDTHEYAENEERFKEKSAAEQADAGRGLMEIFAEFGRIKDTDPASEEAQKLAGKLQDYITDNFYSCSREVLGGLGKMYAAGGEFTENIDAAGGEGTAVFAAKAIEKYCK